MNGRRPVRSVEALSIRAGGMASGVRALPEETPVAFVYNGTTQAVMMATPSDIEDFAVGFSLTEGIIERAGQIETLEVVSQEAGIEARMWIDAARAETLASRRRAMAGPVGCGLCGIDSLEEALRPVASVARSALRLEADDVCAAMDALRSGQALHDRTRAVHAAGFWHAQEGHTLLREDVGRHNALDKLAGAMVRADLDAQKGAVILTSRVSVDMVQKAAALGAPILIAASSPTSHAVRLCDEAGITLVTNVRSDGFDIFTRPDRIDPKASSNVA